MKPHSKLAGNEVVEIPRRIPEVDKRGTDLKIAQERHGKPFGVVKWQSGPSVLTAEVVARLAAQNKERQQK